MDIRDNYVSAKEKAKPIFLQNDQEKIIAMYNLSHDESFLYLTFLGRAYRVNRLTADVECRIKNTWSPCGFNQTISVFDLLAYAKEKPTSAGRWCLVNSLPGVAHTSGLGDGFFANYMRMFANDETGFLAGCRTAGGTALRPGDIGFGDFGFSFTIFEDLTVRLRLYRADDEFPAAGALLWDASTLDYVHYETTYYIAKILLSTIAGDLQP